MPTELPKRGGGRIDRARELRRRSSAPERALWWRVRNRQAAGLKFRRQAPVGPYIADFLCESARLIVEIDSRAHEGRQAYDARRDAWLREHGYRNLRVMAADVMERMDDVLALIMQEAEAGERGENG